MISSMEKQAGFSDKPSEKIKCPVCGYVFAKGQKTYCASCLLNRGNCNFEKCPHCGFDIPQGSRLWDLAAKAIDKFKKTRKNHA